MAYALRSRRDPSPPAPKEHTDIPVSSRTESQTMTSTSNPLVPDELSKSPGLLALLAYTADQVQSVTETIDNLTSKPETELDTQLDIQGPIRHDPGLISSAPQPAGIPSATVPSQQLELAPTQASASTPSASTALHYIPQTESGPPFPVASGHGYIPSISTPITNQPLQLYSSIEAPSTLSLSDSMESSNPKRAGTTEHHSFLGRLVFCSLSTMSHYNAQLLHHPRLR